MSSVAREDIRQRADYTHKFNAKTGRHGWLRLTPAYSVKIVEELMQQYEKPLRVLDPFCGTATTALSAAYHGHEGVTTDINPFLVWLGQVKTASYSRTSVLSTHRAHARVVESVKRKAVEPGKAPPIHNIARWWPEKTLEFLCRLKAGIETESDKDSPERALLSIAFCRTLIELSNAAFNHQSMSFKECGQLHLPLDVDMGHVFSENVRFVLEGAAENPTGSGHVGSWRLQEPAGNCKGSFRPHHYFPAVRKPDVVYPRASALHVLARISGQWPRRGGTGLDGNRRHLGRGNQQASGLETTSEPI